MKQHRRVSWTKATVSGQRLGGAQRTGATDNKRSWACRILAIAWIGVVVASAACGSRPTPIVFTSDRDGNLEIYSVEPSSGKQVNLTNAPDDEFAPAVSPNGRLIAFQVASGDNVAIHVMRMDGTVRTPLTPSARVQRSQTWAPSSDRIAFVSEQDQGSFIYTASAGGSAPVLLTSLAGNEVGDWSRSGDSVVFAAREEGVQGIYVRNPNGVNEFRVTETPDYSPVWSPDSRRIAFLSTRDGNPEIYVMNADGSNQKRLTETDAPEYDISWSPDGRRLLFVSERDGNPEIYRADADGSNQARLTYNSARDDQPVWSRTGKRIAFVSYLDGDAEIFLMNANGKNQVRITNNDAQDTSPSW